MTISINDLKLCRTGDIVMKNSINKRYVPKLRFREFGENWIQSNLKSLETKKYKIENSNLFLDAKAIMKQNYLLWNGEIHKNAPGDSIVFIKDGSNCGTYFYSKNSVKIASTCEYLKFLYSNNFFFHLLSKNKKNIRNSLITGNAIPHIYKKNLLNLNFKFPTNELEQEKISDFLNLLDKQISLLENKLKLTEQAKEWVIEVLYKNARQNNKIKLSEILSVRKTNHITNLDGYIPISIMLYGNGFKKSSLNVKLSKKGRKYYERFSGDLIIGLQNFHNGSIDILNNEYNKPIMSNAIASFVNKSQYPLKIIKYILLSKKHQQYLMNIAEGTGQKEFTTHKILNSYIWIPSNDLIEKFLKLITILEFQINNLRDKKEILKKNKKFYLDNLFI